MTATFVGNIEKVKEKTDDEKRVLASELAGLELINSITEDSDLTGELISHFDSLAVSVKLETTYAPTAMGATGSAGFGNVMMGNVNKIAPEAELFGLIHYRLRSATQFFMPTKEQDRAAYIGMILRLSDEEIRRKYENYPVVIARYELMLEIMEKVGLIEREGV